MSVMNEVKEINGLKIIGITGEAGSGKTTITKLYAKHHKEAYVILTDDVARELMNVGEPCYERVVEHFGKNILKEDMSIDRPKLASIVFNDENELKILNSIVHGEVVSKVRYIINNINCLNNENNCGNIYSVILLESAILFQVEDLVNLDRRERLKRERGYSEERIEAMSISQECIRRMKDRCDKVIINNRDIEKLDNLLFSV